MCDPVLFDEKSEIAGILIFSYKNGLKVFRFLPVEEIKVNYLHS